MPRYFSAGGAKKGNTVIKIKQKNICIYYKVIHIVSL